MTFSIFYDAFGLMATTQGFRNTGINGDIIIHAYLFYIYVLRVQHGRDLITALSKLYILHTKRIIFEENFFLRRGWWGMLVQYLTQYNTYIMFVIVKTFRCQNTGGRRTPINRYTSTIPIPNTYTTTLDSLGEILPLIIFIIIIIVRMT